VGPLSDPKQEAFARFVAQGKSKRHAAIAAGYSQKDASTRGYRLSKKAEIGLRMEELQAQAADKAIENATLLVDLEIASKQERCRVYGDIYQRMLQVVEERAADASMAKVPGGRTGLLVRQIKVLGSGANQKVVPESVVDTGLLRQIRATAQQAAEELGQWKSDADATAADRGRVVIALPDEAEQELKPQNAGKRIPPKA
jgi:phage terminase small subunit